MSLIEWIDLPPFWLLGALVLTWLVPVSLPWGKAILPGVLCLGVAAFLVLAALVSFRQARTSVIPRQAPAALISGGIFRLTRNPIYLADLLILLGFTLIWGHALGLLLVPALAVLLDRRFICGEEARLRAAFGEDYDRYAAGTRRWL